MCCRHIRDFPHTSTTTEVFASVHKWCIRARVLVQSTLSSRMLGLKNPSVLIAGSGPSGIATAYNLKEVAGLTSESV